MKYHPLSRTTVHTRKQIVEAVLSERLSLNEAAVEFKLSRQSAGKWVKRFPEEGITSLADPQLASCPAMASNATRGRCPG